MFRFLSRLLHGLVTDYPYVLVVGASPWLFNFTYSTPAVLATRLLAGTILVSSLFTRAEWGMFRVLPFRVHLILDVLGGLIALASPWLFGFADVPAARNFVFVAGIFGIGAGLCSKPEEMSTGNVRASGGLGLQ